MAAAIFVFRFLGFILCRMQKKKKKRKEKGEPSILDVQGPDLLFQIRCIFGPFKVVYILIINSPCNISMCNI